MRISGWKRGQGGGTQDYNELTVKLICHDTMCTYIARGSSLSSRFPDLYRDLDNNLALRPLARHSFVSLRLILLVVVRDSESAEGLYLDCFLHGILRVREKLREETSFHPLRNLLGDDSVWP